MFEQLVRGLRLHHTLRKSWPSYEDWLVKAHGLKLNIEISSFLHVSLLGIAILRQHSTGVG
jgi:hypothetical protein